MGSVRRPMASSAWSLQPCSSVTVCRPITSGVARSAVASAATAFTPFSQNSKLEVCCRSGQAQPGQSKPSGWLADSSVREPLAAMRCCSNWRATLRSAPQPPAGPL